MLTDQVQKAKSAELFSKILTDDKTKIVVIVPGSEGKQYRVIVRLAPGKVETECHLLTGSGDIVCKGNEHSLCYHSLTAIRVAVHARNRDIRFCGDEAAATLLSRVGGKAVVIESRDSKKTRWGLVQ